MRCVKIIIDHLNDTLQEAQEYYRDYIIYKDSNPKIANVSLDIGKMHLSQIYPRLHDTVVSIIKEYNGDIPKTMQEMWDFEHKKLVEEYDELKYKYNTL